MSGMISEEEMHTMTEEELVKHFSDQVNTHGTYTKAEYCVMDEYRRKVYAVINGRRDLKGLIIGT